ncbi:MAG: hydrolase [Oscillospiraceae bacterium]|nr:hydrolase [Oscillospiraceae bacterium]
MNRNEAWALLSKYNKEEFHLQHAVTVENIMAWFARELGYGDEEEYWSLVGLLHDIDFEQWPEEHCKKAPELLSDGGAGDDMIRSICSHGYGICSDVEPVHEMEKVLFASDELTGLIWAAALMRPSKSTKDMELKSLKKKFKDKKFAAGCSRDIISRGAEMLGWTLDELMDRTLRAMQACEDDINRAREAL